MFRPSPTTLLCLTLLGSTAGMFWDLLGSIEILSQEAIARMESLREEDLTVEALMEAERREPGRGHAAAAFEALEKRRSRELLESLGVPASPLKIGEVQDLLDDETLLLAYSLGEERSFLWKVTRDRIESFELPPRDRIARETLRFLDLLRKSQRREARVAPQSLGRPLSRMILGPVVDSLEERRLLVVADAPLQSLPFAALPDPRSPEGVPLIARHEVVSLPSASALAALRQREQRPPPPGLIAVLGDPVFGVEDERLSREAPRGVGAAGIARSGIVPETGSFHRLPGSRRETESILHIASAGPTLSATGFDASRELVTSGRLSGYRIVHFATHGVLDLEEPGRSGIVLSQFDRQGRRRDGTLRADEIRRLDLPADLVVLSACDTGLGADLGGNGRTTLLRSFLEAGASRVVASLWAVDDRATAELMTRFYKGLLVDRLSAAAALRQAQISMMEEPRWSAHYYWAGFLVEGDWR